MFNNYLRHIHGQRLYSIPDGYWRDEIRSELLSNNMPVWPAEGSIAIINDVIVINFGINY